jgi:hypothetical protein
MGWAAIFRALGPRIAHDVSSFVGSLPCRDVAKGLVASSSAPPGGPAGMKQKFYSQVKIECVFFFRKANINDAVGE